MARASVFDLDAYLERIGVGPLLGSDRSGLDRIHLAHLRSIPFENLDIHLGRAIRVDIESVFSKLVLSRRGGYCFEHNTLLAAAIESLGYDVVRLGARVGEGDPSLLKRTHMTLLVRDGDHDVIADVGFGAGGMLEPIPLRDGVAVEQRGRVLRFTTTSYGWTLQQIVDGEWRDQYHFTFEEQFESDRVIANYYTSTHPDSGFVRTLTVQRDEGDAHWILRGRTLNEVRNGEDHVRIVEDDELLDVLSRVFGLDFPPGTVFRSPNDR
jgi:N-hydroxyarylamine O-acetyltransferase